MAQIKTKLAYGVSGTLATANIADDAITSAKIADNAVVTAAINADAITSAKIADNAVVTAAINADAVTDAKIADDVIGTEHLTAGEVDTTALGADSVNATKIADDSISEEHLDNSIITSLSAKTTLVDADKFIISDSADSGNLKKVDKSDFVSSAGWTLISTNNISDGDSTFNLAFTGSYGIYALALNNVCCNNNDNTFRHAFSDDNFTSVNQQLYGAYYRQEARRDNSTSSSTGHQAATGYVRIADHVGSGQYEGLSGLIYYANMKTAAPKSRYWGNTSSHHQDERMSNHMLTGWADVTNVITGVAYNFDSGTFKSGQFKLYGLN